MTRRWQKRPSQTTTLVRQAMFDAQAPDDYKKRALIDGVDIAARAMERKWGIDRLRLLVPDQLRSAFDQQKDLLDGAIRSDDLHLIDIQANGMKRAWQALDAAATQADQQTLSAEVWEFRLPSSGKAVAVVRTTAEAHLIATPERETWTLTEIAHLIETVGGTLSEIKRTFPGAELTAIHKTEINPTPPDFDWSKGDDIPF